MGRNPAAEPLADVPQLIRSTALSALIFSPNYAAKQWVYEQYDTMVMADSARTRSIGSGIVRIHGTDKALAFTSDVTPRYVKANPLRAANRRWPKPIATCALLARGLWPRPTT